MLTACASSVEPAPEISPESPWSPEPVWLDLSLDAEGRVAAMEIVEPQPAEIEALLKAWAAQARYEPGENNGQPVPRTISVLANFNTEPKGPGVAISVDAGSPQARPTRIVRPRFPQAAMRAHRGGSAKVAFVIDEKGRPREFEVIESSDRAFEEPTIDALKQWRFKVQTVDGQPVRQSEQQTIEYNVERR